MIDLSQLWEQILVLDFTPTVLALVLGGAIGLEREVHGRPAGMRTHMLVCLCSTILMLASKHAADVVLPQGGNLVFDPQRLAAGIVTGIGFLGAAAVVRAGDLIRGLTTGACVWCVAGLGVVLGQGQYALAVVATVAYLFVLVVLDWMPIKGVIYRQLKVRGPAADVEHVAGEVRSILNRHGLRVQELAGTLDDHQAEFELVFQVRCRDTMRAPQVLRALGQIDEVSRASWAMPRL